MAQHVQSNWDQFVAVHRYEDLALIRSVIGDCQPIRVVELGTAEGGFAAFLACTVIEWDGIVLSLDKLPPDPGHAEYFRDYYDNLTLVQAEILDPTPETVALLQQWLSGPDKMLYTDNGNKQRELELYVPMMGTPALVGTHDYGTEVDPEWAEAYMASQGFRPYRHEEFAALANEYYPVSLTRFWVRGDWPHAHHIDRGDAERLESGVAASGPTGSASALAASRDQLHSERTAEDQAQS